MTYADLCLSLARAVKDESDLSRVPVPVIASAIEHGLRHLSLHCPPDVDLAEIDAYDFEPCEGCGNYIDPAITDGARSDPEAGWFCSACVVEMKDATP